MATTISAKPHHSISLHLEVNKRKEISQHTWQGLQSVPPQEYHIYCV